MHACAPMSCNFVLGLMASRARQAGDIVGLIDEERSLIHADVTRWHEVIFSKCVAYTWPIFRRRGMSPVYVLHHWLLLFMQKRWGWYGSIPSGRWSRPEVDKSVAYSPFKSVSGAASSKFNDRLLSRLSRRRDILFLARAGIIVISSWAMVFEDDELDRAVDYNTFTETLNP